MAEYVRFLLVGRGLGKSPKCRWPLSHRRLPSLWNGKEGEMGDLGECTGCWEVGVVGFEDMAQVGHKPRKVDAVKYHAATCLSSPDRWG